MSYNYIQQFTIFAASFMYIISFNFHQNLLKYILPFPHLYTKKNETPGKLRNLVKVPQLTILNKNKDPRPLTQTL